MPDRKMRTGHFAALALLCSSGACTVDLGAVPDAAACAASTDFFVSDVYPRYLAATGCGSSRDCHAFPDGHGYFRLRPVGAAPAPGTPLAQWPVEWSENYLAAIQLLRCDDPAASRLLVVPAGQSNLHPPGPVVRDRAAAQTLLETWVGLPR
jgi:hypothetical protein